MIHLDYRDARPMYQQILEGFRSQIRSGILLEGERMPSVRELATQLAINPNTIQRAYRELEAQGWIVSIGGKGSFVSGTPTQERDRLLEEFDQLTATLLALGITPQQLRERMEKGADDHA